jgi:hypothetical protein
MGEACSTHGRDKNAYKVFGGKREGKDLSINVILKCILKK